MLPRREPEEGLASYLDKLSREEIRAMADARKAAMLAMAERLFGQIQDRVRSIAASRSYGGMGSMAIPIEEVMIPLDDYTDKIYESSEGMLADSLDELEALVNAQTGAYGISAVVELRDFPQVVDVQLIRR